MFRFVEALFMAQHFLLSAAARSLSPAKVMRMSDLDAEDVFLRLRWPETDGKAVCPNCGCQICYDCRRPAGQSRWRCKAGLSVICVQKVPLRKVGKINDIALRAGDHRETGGQAATAVGRNESFAG